MLSNLTRSVRRKLQADSSSPARSARIITFTQPDRGEPPDQKRSSLQRRESDRSQHLPHAGHDSDSGDEEDETEEQETDQEEETSHSDSEDEVTPLLPIFSSEHLNALPVFALTHAFREMVIERCDTVLTWEQLRSPQVSQFLIKPIQQEIRDHHMNSATHYALLANALQFIKEANLNPGNSGTNRTRAMVCELIAIKLLRECSTRELINSLSFDFNPLQGYTAPETAPQPRRPSQRATRISCIEIAIHANAKRFLAHPMVVQHLEAIWNGSIVFYSAADNMHRKRELVFQTSYGTDGRPPVASHHNITGQRTAIIYNPRDASLFKLSRLRVPRYRNILSTISFAVLLLLFMAVIQERSRDITTLEVIFWAWAAGYMLDEVIGFNEQGFGLYLASFWNTFDVGILLLLFVHLCLRLYGLMLPDDDSTKRAVANRAYDVLATSAILLFPRLFSVLDHYRYFSQLIIAFRMMAADMLAIFLLILIFCSGFLVALTFAFSKGNVPDNPKDVAYALLQMLLGFTPAAWDRWGEYNWLGRFVLILFLFVCHFVVVTILITVMTNSFMEIVRNANEEHQYLFAVNVMSNVKSDALFAYVPPTNVLQWLLTPLRYVLPFRDYLKVNRTIIKLTHLPILWLIYLYEKLVLQPRYVDTVDLVESRGRIRQNLAQRLPRLMRDPSITTFRQNAALEEVFRSTTMRTSRSQERHKSSNVVNNWMNHMDGEDAEPPQEEDHKVMDKLEKRSVRSRRHLSSKTRDFSTSRRPTSIASDPYDFTSHGDFLSPKGRFLPTSDLTPSALGLPSNHTDADGDDELLTNQVEEDTETNVTFDEKQKSAIKSGRTRFDTDYFAPRVIARMRSPTNLQSSDSGLLREGSRMVKGPWPSTGQDLRPRHSRNISTATMIHHPSVESDSESKLPVVNVVSLTKQASVDNSMAESATGSSKPSTSPSLKNLQKKAQLPLQFRPALPTKDNAAFQSMPNTSGLLPRSKPLNTANATPNRPRRSSLEMDLVSDIGDNKAIGGGYVGAIPASFASQMAYANNVLRQSQRQLQEQEQMRRNEDNDIVARVMMARMNTLEEGFREVVHEVRETMKQVGSGLVSRQRSPERGDSLLQSTKRAGKRSKDRPERTALSGSGASSTIFAGPDGERPITAGSGSASGSVGFGTQGKDSQKQHSAISPKLETSDIRPPAIIEEKAQLNELPTEDQRMDT